MENHTKNVHLRSMVKDFFDRTKRDDEQEAPNWSFTKGTTAIDPLLESLISIIHLHGISISGKSLCTGLPLEGNQLTPHLFSRAAARAGMDSRLARRDLSDIRPELLPVVLLLKNKQSCVFLEYLDGEQVRIQFPEQSQSSEIVTKTELREIYEGVVFFVRPKFSFDVRAPSHLKRTGKHWFWSVVVQNWQLYRDAMLAALLVNIFAFFLPLFSMTVYDRVIPNQAEATLWLLVAGVCIMMGFDIVLKTVRAYILDTASKRIDNTLSAKIMERVLGLKMADRPKSVGAFAANLRAFESVKDFIASATITTLIDLPFALIFLIALAWISPWFLLPCVACIGLLLIASMVAQKKMGELVDEGARASSQRQATLVESLVGIEAIKSFNAESHFQRQYEQATVYANNQSSKLKIISSTTVNLAQSLAQFLTVAIIFVGVYLSFNKEVSQGAIIAATMIAARCIMPFAQISGLLMQFHTAKNGLSSIEKHMEMEPERKTESGYIHREHFDGDIELKNISFGYLKDSNVLTNVSLKIKAGERVALIGRVGSGKSTVLRMLMGLQKPEAGAVCLDGVDIRQVDPVDARAAFGYVSQEVQLFFGSLKSNIALGQPFSSDQDILNAVKLSGLSEFVNSHPRGLEMVIGERGETLSGGQRQAVGLARAYLNNPSILLLDEPTSSMDHQSESAFKERLRAFSEGKTLLIVTHKPSLLELVDRLVVIDKGQIVADGPKAQVMLDFQNGKVVGAK